MRGTKQLLEKACHHLKWDRLLQRLEWLIEMWALLRVALILILVLLSMILPLITEVKSSGINLETEYTDNK